MKSFVCFVLICLSLCSCSTYCLWKENVSLCTPEGKLISLQYCDVVRDDNGREKFICPFYSIQGEINCEQKGGSK